MGSSWSKRAPLWGVLAVVLFIVAFAVGGETPDAGDSASKVINFYSDNESSQWVAALGLFYAAIATVLFGYALRGVLLRADEGVESLAALAFTGSAIFAVGVLLFAGLTISLVDPGDALEPAAAQAINALNSDMFPVLAGGLALFLVPAGMAWRKVSSLPSWLGWVAIVIGIVAATPLGFFGFLAGMLWILVVSILLTVRPVGATT